MERKEIIQLNGLTILIAMVIIADLLVVGFMYRWHQYQVFVENKRHGVMMTELRDRIAHDLKIEIVALEGVPAWNETAYFKNAVGAE